jgi:hypothetical protein
LLGVAGSTRSRQAKKPYRSCFLITYWDEIRLVTIECEHCIPWNSDCLNCRERKDRYTELAGKE